MSRARWGALALGCGAALLACVSDSPSVKPDASTTDGGTNDSSPPQTPPVHAATSISLLDGDVAMGTVNGTVTIGKATDESDVDSYVLYWGVDATTKRPSTPAVLTIKKTGSDITASLSGTVPVGTTKLLVFTANAAGEMSTGPSTDADNFPRYVDISAGAGQGSGVHPSAAIDGAGGKLVVGTNGANVFRCGLDGTACSHTSAGTGAADTRVLVDTANGKLLVVEAGPLLFRCNLDGTSCASTDIGAAAGQTGGNAVSPVIDSTNGKLLVTAQMNFVSSHLGLYRCNLDGTSCGFTDLTTKTSKGAYSGQSPSATIDTVNHKLLVATSDGLNTNLANLFVCALDGSACATADISVGQGADSGLYPAIALDAANGKVLTVAYDLGHPALYRCDLDGSNCTYHDIGAGKPMDQSTPSAVVDVVQSKLWVAAAVVQKLGIFRCELDGTACTFVDASAGRPAGSANAPSAVIDPTNQRLLVATDDSSNVDRPALFTLGLW